jgi:hypothetical protein
MATDFEFDESVDQMQAEAQNAPMNSLITHEAMKSHNEELRRRAGRHAVRRGTAQAAVATITEPARRHRVLPLRVLFSR